MTRVRLGSKTIPDGKVNTKHSILFRCDGSHEVGFGHIIRCLALADELKDNHGCDIMFAILRDNKAIELIESHGYQVTLQTQMKKIFAMKTG